MEEIQIQVRKPCGCDNGIWRCSVMGDRRCARCEGTGLVLTWMPIAELVSLVLEQALKASLVAAPLKRARRE